MQQTPVRMGTEELIIELESMIEHLWNGDSTRGTIEYLAADGGAFLVQGSYRVGPSSTHVIGKVK